MNSLTSETSLTPINEIYRFSCFHVAASRSPESEAEELGEKLEATKKVLTAVSKEVGDDKDAPAALETIGGHLNKAMAKHK